MHGVTTLHLTSGSRRDNLNDGSERSPLLGLLFAHWICLFQGYLLKMFTVFSFKLASIEVWKQSISSQGCIFGLEFKPDGTSWKKTPCEICHCEVGIYICCMGYWRVRSNGWIIIFFFVYKYQDAIEINNNGKKNERGQHPAFLSEQNWPIEEYFLAQRSWTTLPLRLGSRFNSVIAQYKGTVTYLAL